MTDRWRHDRTGDRVPDDGDERPRGQVTTATRAPMFEVFASWIGDDGKVAGAWRLTPDRSELQGLIDELRRAHGARDGFGFEVDIVDARGQRRSMVERDQRSSQSEAKAEIQAIRDALANRPLDPPLDSSIDLNEAF